MCKNNGVLPLVLDSEYNGNLGVCRTCGVAYAYKCIVDEAFAIIYGFYVPSIMAIEDIMKKQEKQRIKQLNEEIDIIESYVSRGHVLDIGASNGDFLAYARVRGWEVTATELSSICRQYMEGLLKLNVKMGQIQGLEFEESTYNVVSLRHSNEHLKYPVEDLKHLRRALTDNGILFITTPEHAKDLDVLRENHMLPQHIVNYTKKTITYLLSLAGFKMIKYIDKSNSEGLAEMLVIAIKEREVNE